MSINPVNSVNPVCTSFKGNHERKLVSVQEYPDYVENKYESEASKGKKWGVGLASFCLMGLGQLINGDILKGVGFIAGDVAMAIASKKNMKMALPLLACKIWSVVDAVKNAKTTETEIVSKVK